jgi:hypothetical protein
MNQRRLAGFLFCEPGSDPKPFLEDGWRYQQAARDAVETGQVDPANSALALAVKAAEDAQGAVEKTVKAKARCEEAFARRSAATRRCDDAARLAQQRQQELERDFAPDSWRDVSANQQNARSLLSSADAALDEATSLAAPHVQHYQRAATLAEQAEKQRADSLPLLAAIERRLNELVELRRRCRDELDGLRRRVDSLAESLRRSLADRPRVNELCGETVRLILDLRTEADRARTDWPRIEIRLKEIAKNLEEAERLAQEDARLAQQASDEVAKGQREIQQAQGFSRLGFSADLSACRHSLDEAQRRLAAQEYEEAIRLAGRAGQEARQAVAEAERRASEKQAQLDHERRQREAQAASAQAAGK